MNEKYLRHTIINMCEEAKGVATWRRNEQAFDILKAANTILEFERWNQSSSQKGLFDELSELVEDTAKEIAIEFVHDCFMYVS